MSDPAPFPAKHPRCPPLKSTLHRAACAAIILPALAWADSLPDPAAATTWTLESDHVRLEVFSAYSYRLVEKSTGNILLTQNQTAFTVGGKSLTATSLSGVTTTATSLTGTLTLNNHPASTGSLSFSFVSPDRLRVDCALAGTPPTTIAERFTSAGERYYGVAETAVPANLDNRGTTIAYNGQETTTKEVFASSARAPFYMTSNHLGLYVPTQATGSYTFAAATGGNTSFSFNQPTLRYETYYGADYKAILGQYRAAAGPAYMPPDWAFSTIWWRDDWHHLPTDSSGNRVGTATNAQSLVAEDAAKLAQYHIPASALWLDRPYGSGDPGRDANVGGWGNMDYDTSSAGFPDPTAMVRSLDAAGLKLLLWIANKANNQLYTDAAANGWLLPSSSATPAIDLSNPAAYAYFKTKLDQLQFAATLADGSAGIAGYKIDRGGEGEMPLDQINTQTTLLAKLAYEGLVARHGSDFFQFTRNINDTGRQYAAVWSGDPTTTWTGFQSSVRNGIRSGLIYFPIWGSDTGGYSGGTPPSEELFTRWMAFSAYSPMMEILQDQKRNIWFNYSPALLSVTQTYTQTHHDLAPYTRSLAWEAATTGVPIMRAMFLEFPNDPAAADLGDQYMLGPSLLVAPVTTAGATSRSVYLPAGRWLDYNNRTTLYTSTGQSYTIAAPLATIPVFVREGALIPRGDIVQANDTWTPNWSPSLHIELFPSPAIDASVSYYTGTTTVPLRSHLDGHLLRYLAADTGLPGAAEFYLGRFFTMSSLALVRRNGQTLTSADYTFDPATNLLRVPFSSGTGTDIQVRLTSSPDLNQWQAGSGNFTDPAHWSRASVPNSTPDNPDRAADFLANPGTPTTVTVSTDISLASLAFDSPTSYTLTGPGSIHLKSLLATLALLDVLEGHHTLTVPLFIDSDTLLTLYPGTSLEIDHLTLAPGATLYTQGSGSLRLLDLPAGLTSATLANLAWGPAGVPEPATLALLALGATTLLIRKPRPSSF